jgi:hypothetical protein
MTSSAANTVISMHVSKLRISLRGCPEPLEAGKTTRPAVGRPLVIALLQILERPEACAFWKTRPTRSTIPGRGSKVRSSHSRNYAGKREKKKNPNPPPSRGSIYLPCGVSRVQGVRVSGLQNIGDSGADGRNGNSYSTTRTPPQKKKKKKHTHTHTHTHTTETCLYGAYTATCMEYMYRQYATGIVWVGTRLEIVSKLLRCRHTEPPSRYNEHTSGDDIAFLCTPCTKYLSLNSVR